MTWLRGHAIHGHTTVTAHPSGLSDQLSSFESHLLRCPYSLIYIPDLPHLKDLGRVTREHDKTSLMVGMLTSVVGTECCDKMRNASGMLLGRRAVLSFSWSIMFFLQNESIPFFNQWS